MEGHTALFLRRSFEFVLIFPHEEAQLRGADIRKGSDRKLIGPFCGDGRTRTAVQTPHQTAFYTLSLTLVFDQGLPSDGLPKAYPLNLSGA